MASVDPVVQLANRYKSEFEQQLDGLRQRSAQLSADAQQQLQQLQQQAQDLQPLALQKKDELAGVLSDLGPVEGLKAPRLLETFSWTAVLLLTFSLVSGVSALALAPLLGLVLDSSTALLLAYVLLPVLALKHVQLSAADDQTARFKLLAFAGAEGLLVGFLLSDRALSTGGPLLFLTPLLIGLVAQLADGKLGSRQALLGATVGGALGTHLLLGLLAGQLSLGYLLLALLYSAVGAATLQLYLKYELDQERPTHLYQLGYFVGALLAQGLVYLLLGAPYADQAAAAPAASQ